MLGLPRLNSKLQSINKLPVGLWPHLKEYATPTLSVYLASLLMTLGLDDPGEKHLKTLTKQNKKHVCVLMSVIFAQVNKYEKHANAVGMER